MRRLLVILSVISSVFLWISLAASDILDSSYSVNSNEAEYTTVSDEHFSTDNQTSSNQNVTRTVITAVPKTWPSGNFVWIIIATLVIFGGYIYIKKRADI